MRVLIVTLVFLTQCAQAQQYGWVRVAQLGNQFTSLSAVEFVDSLHGWAAEGSATTYRSNDGGTSWTPCVVNAPLLVTSISMVNTQAGWCVGNQGTRGRILHTTDGGTNWFEEFFLDNRNYLSSASLSQGKNITSGRTRNFSPDTGKVIRTSDGGTSWNERTLADSIRRLGKVQFIDSLHGWVVAFLQSTAGILKTDDGGVTWAYYQTPFASGFSAISFIDALRGWGISGGAWVNKTTDGGMTWQPQFCICTSEDELIPSALSFVDSLNGWAFGTIFFEGDLAAAIYRTTDGGYTWMRDHVGGARGVTGMMLDLYHGWAVGTAGAVFAYRLMTSAPERVNQIPRAFALHQNYPNPFNPRTTIEYEVVQRSMVDIAVFDVNGKEVLHLVNSFHEPGVYRIGFDAGKFASGTYYYAMKTGTFSETRRMVLVK